VSRIVLFGATGFTGRLTAHALAAQGARPVLAGRRRDALDALAHELGDLEVAVADATRPESVRELLEPGDVLVTTVGPMARWGAAALDATIDASAHYVDSSGESAWVRRVFERAATNATVVLPATGYDSVPGNLAGALALREAGPSARRVRIGYFLTGTRGRGLLGGLRETSGGTRATVASMAHDEGFAFRAGGVRPQRAAARVGRFRVGGQVRHGISFGTSEAFSLPRLYPQLSEVEAYFGWFDRASRMLQAGALPLTAAAAIPPIRRGIAALTTRRPARRAEPAGGTSGSLFVAEALDDDRLLARIVLEGINGYAFTGNMLAWTARAVADGKATGHGALGPVEAFGIEALEAGVALAGIARTA
jgi:short subunit dehydrogenase-like uncharacterized protein